MNSPLCLLLMRWLPPLALALAAGAATAQADPPARVAALSQMEGTVAFAPAGETEWADAAMNRPVTAGDRLFTDPGARAEVHLGSAALHLASQTFVEVIALDDDVLQLNLKEGTVNARVRQLEGGENFEIATPQLAFRAAQAGDYRIDADPARGHTRVAVRSGVAMIYGSGGGVLQLRAGQQMAFTGRDLAAVAIAVPLEDAFDRWAADRNRAEDQSISARYVPREVVGYHELDANGAWSQDPNYGAVWYPAITVADWAPYRYGHWEWVVPWGWTWIDDARWGFAPFHYGRWAQIGSRWAWVPGRIGRRPVYSPALVAFVGGGGTSLNLSVGAGPGIGWFPLAPGEAWRPTYRTSTVYLRNANRNVVFNNTAGGFHFQRRPEAITAVRVENFNRGRPVHRHWRRVNPADLARVQIDSQPVLPAPRRFADTARADQPRPQTQLAAPPVVPGPRPQFQPPGPGRREFGDGTRPAFVAPGISQRQQPRAQEEQRRSPPPAAVQQAERAQQIQQMQQMQRQRQEQDRQQRMQREQGLRQQHEPMQRQQQQAIQQQERMQRQQERVQRAMPPPRQLPPQAAAPAAVQPHAPPPRVQGRERAQERSARGHEQREQRAGQGGDDDRGRSRGHRFN